MEMWCFRWWIFHKLSSFRSFVLCGSRWRRDWEFFEILRSRDFRKRSHRREMKILVASQCFAYRKSSRQTTWALGKPMRLSESDAKWLYQTLGCRWEGRKRMKIKTWIQSDTRSHFEAQLYVNKQSLSVRDRVCLDVRVNYIAVRLFSHYIILSYDEAPFGWPHLGIISTWGRNIPYCI